MAQREMIIPVAPNVRDARKEIGMGMPPDCYGSNAAVALADQCDPEARIVIAEVARWRTDVPILDTDMETFGDKINVWGTPDGQPPRGVTTASNTLGTPGIFAADMIIRGISVRVLVEPESRLIRGQWMTPEGANIPGGPDVFTQNDLTNNALGLAVGQPAPTPAELLFGIPTWKIAYDLVNAYELAVEKDHQDQLIKEPLTSVAHIEPFAEAEAAGLVFGSNQDQVNLFNARVQALGVANQFQPVGFKRLGRLANGGTDVSDFTATREEDASMTMWGGPGVPQSRFQKDPFLFTTPLFWPAGHPMKILFTVNDQAYQAQMQRWLSLTGGVGGLPGTDLSLPFSNLIAAAAGFNGLSPSVPGANVMLEQSLDTASLATEQVQTNRAILKFGAWVIEIGVIGFRVSNPAWYPVVAAAIKAGAISAPKGWGSLTSYMRG